MRASVAQAAEPAQSGGRAGEGSARPPDRDRARRGGTTTAIRAADESSRDERREAAMKTDPSPGATATDAGGLGRRVGLFVAVAYGASWVIWAPLVAGHQDGGCRYLHLLGALGPAAGALIATAREGRSSLRALASRLQSRAPPPWHAQAVLGAIPL
jgi:hypothetical protein